MVNPYSRLAEFIQPVRGYSTGDEIIKYPNTAEELLKPSTGAEELLKSSTGAEELLKPSTGADWKAGSEQATDYAIGEVSGQIGQHLRRKYKPRFDWKAAIKWMKDFHNQKHSFQKPSKTVIKPTKFDRLMFSVFSPTKKATIIKNIALNTGYKISPDLIDKVQSYFSSDKISNLDKYIEQQKQTISPHGYKGIYEAGEKSLRKLVGTINAEFTEPVDPAKNIFTGTDLENILENKRAVISENQLIENPEIAKNFEDYMSQRRYKSTQIKTEKEYNETVEKFLDKIEPIKDQQNDPLLLRDLLTESWKEVTGKDVITSSAQAEKLNKMQTKNQWRRFYDRFIERNPQYKNIPFSKFEFDKQLVTSKINELVEEGMIPKYMEKETKDAAIFHGVFKKNYMDKFPELAKGRIRENQMARYLNFIRRTTPNLVDVNKDPNYTKFFSVYNPNELNIPGSKFYKDYQKFIKLDNKRAELSKLLQPILKKISPEDSKFSIQLAHRYVSSEIGDTVSKTKIGTGGDPGEMYLDLSSTNFSKQTKLEERARSLQKLYEDTDNPEHLIEIAAIDTIMRDLGVEGQVVSPIVDDLGNVVAEPGFTLGQAETNLIRKIINIAEANKVRLSEKDKVILRKAYNLFQQKAEGGMVQSMKDGGIIRYFQDGTGEEGVTADQGPISGFDVKPYIPPGARFDQDPLTLGDIGTGVSEAAETMWPYMIPGVGEALSLRDYQQFSSEAEKAKAEGKTSKYIGMTLLGTVALGGTIPNWTVVGAVPNIVLGAYKGVKKAITPKAKMIAPPVPKEKRFVIKDSQNKSVDWKKTKEEADEAVSKLSAAEGGEFRVIETEVPVIKPVKTKKELVKTQIDVTPEMVIGTGNNRTYYSKLDELLTNPTGNMRVKQGTAGSTVDIPINEVSLTAKEWHNTLRAAGIKESELSDAYIRQYLNKIGKWDQTANNGRGAFTSNAKISYNEIKGLADESPSRFLQTSKYSTKDGNLKYSDTGHTSGYKTDTAEEHILWMDSKDIKGDAGKISNDLKSQTQSHGKMREVKTDVNFAANNKLDGEPYVIGWSLVADRPGKLANGKTVTVNSASEIQSDFLQLMQKRKTQLKKDIKEQMSILQDVDAAPYQMANARQRIKETEEKLRNLVRPLGMSTREIDEIITGLTKNQQIFHKASKLSLDDMTPAVFKELDLAAKEREAILSRLDMGVDNMTLKEMFPNVPLKDTKQWVDALIKNDISLAAKNRFYFDENGVMQINKNAPSHYTVAPSKVVKEKWSVPDDQFGMHVPPNMRTTEQHGKGVAFDMEYGGPKVVDHNGNPFRGNAEETMRRIAAEKNAEFSIGKVKFEGTFEDSFLIELTPEMLTPYVQYFKHGGLVEAIPYNPLRSVLDALGPIGAY